MSARGETFSVRFEQRDFSGPRLAAGLRLEVQRLEWRAVGGPWRATLMARASRLEELWQAADLLRCAVQVSDELGPAWWGYVRAVEICDGANRARLDLGKLVNDAMVRYRAPGPEPWGGEETWTGAAVDSASRAEYGRKAGVYALGVATQAQAEAYRAAMLGRWGWPVMEAATSPDGAADEPEPYALLECWGWWETLDWLYYSDGRGAVGNLTAGIGQTIGKFTNTLKWGESFYAGAESWTLSEVWVRLRKEGIPTDGVVMEVTTSNGLPLTTLASVTVGWQAISQEWGWVRFGLAAPLLLTGGATYWVVVSREAAPNSVNHYLISADLALGYANGIMRYYDGAAWLTSSQEGDLTFMARGTLDQGAILTRMLSAGAGGCGQFLAGLKLEDAPGFAGVPWRDGRERGRAEVEGLLKQGAANGARLLAVVEPDRWVRVMAQPRSGAAELLVARDGAIRWRSGRKLYCSEQAAGRWAGLGALADAGGLAGGAGVGEVFIESCAWSAGRGLRLARA